MSCCNMLETYHALPYHLTKVYKDLMHNSTHLNREWVSASHHKLLYKSVNALLCNIARTKESGGGVNVY
jgi:hypothetical protein